LFSEEEERRNAPCFLGNNHLFPGFGGLRFFAEVGT
jgi:hypothetical protein